MPHIGKAVTFANGLFHLLDWTGIDHQSNPAALSADQVIVMLLRI
jgi:hypothetical protein